MAHGKNHYNVQGYGDGKEDGKETQSGLSLMKKGGTGEGDGVGGVVGGEVERNSLISSLPCHQRP